VNQDSLLVDAERKLFAVADGVGGGKAGEVASQLLTSMLHERLAKVIDGFETNGVTDDAACRDEIIQELTPAIVEASEAIYRLGRTSAEYEGMATTATIMQVVESTAVIAHVGDSRLYIMRGDEHYQLTEDHTLVQQLVRRRAIQPEEVAAFPHRNVIIRSVGHSPSVQVDALVLEMLPGDRLVLCTDGLTDHVGPDEIHRITTSLPPREATSRLIERANEEGGSDNISVIVIEVAGGTETTAVLRTEKKADILRNIFLFRELSFPQMVRVMGALQEVRFDSGEVIIRGDAPGDDLFIIIQGQAVAKRRGVTLATFGPGDYFGELGLLGGQVRSATVTATHACSLLKLSRSDFLALIDNDQQLAVRLLWRLLQQVAERLRTATSDLSDPSRPR
jgi:serine/threonine protein phosphatase PrpC